MSRIEGYRARIGDVDLALLRGGVTLRDLELRDGSGTRKRPLFRARSIESSIHWRPLWRERRLVADVVVVEPEIDLVLAPTAAGTQLGLRPDWPKQLERIEPLELDGLEVRSGRIHFEDRKHEPAFDVEISNLEVDGENLADLRALDDERPGHVHVSGRAFESGELVIDIAVDVQADAPDLALEGRLEDVDMTDLNGLFRALGAFDVESGRLSIYAALDASAGRFSGTVTPIVHDLDVLADESGPEASGEDGASWLRTAWEGFIGAVAEVFENQPEDQQATRIPVSGEFEDPHVGVWQALVALLRNAFVQAIEPQMRNAAAARRAWTGANQDGDP
ncbi:MAG: DUF748 domain-containing protein [Myxococcota bacterium]